MSLNSGIKELGVTSATGYGMHGSGRGNMVLDVMSVDMTGVGRGDGSYDMFDVDDDSQESIPSGSASTAGTCYDDAPSDVFEENARSGALAFGDRIY